MSSSYLDQLLNEEDQQLRRRNVRPPQATFPNNAGPVPVVTGVREAGMVTTTTLAIVGASLGALFLIAIIVGGVALGEVRADDPFQVEDLTIVSMEEKNLEVGPTKPYATIAEALAYANGRHTGVATVRVDKGTYASTTEIGAKFASGLSYSETSTRPVSRGLTIIGDERGIAGQTYVNGAAVRGSGTRASMSVTGGSVSLNDGFLADWTSGPFNLGTLPYALTAATVLADDGNPLTPEEGCGAYTTPANYVGKIALVRRGSCGFSLKSTNAFAAGAIGVIIYNQAGGPIPIGGADPMPLTGPTVFIGSADGDALVAQIPMDVTISKDSVVVPKSGTPGGIVTFSHPSGLSTLTVTVSDAPEGIDLEQPDFLDAGLENGDRVVVVCPGRIEGNSGLPKAVTETAVIDSVSGNTITFQAPLAQDAAEERSDCSITILPNRVLQGTLSPDGQILEPVISVSGSASAVFRGFTIAGNPAAGFSQGAQYVAVNGYGSLALPNCVVDATDGRANGGIELSEGYLSDDSENAGNLGSGGSLAIIGLGLTLTNGAFADLADFFSLAPTLTCVSATAHSTAWFGSLTCGWSDDVDNFDNAGVEVISSASVYVSSYLYLYRNWVNGIYASNAASVATGVDCDANFVRNGHVSVYDLAAADIHATMGARVTLDGPVTSVGAFRVAESFNTTFDQIGHAHAGSIISIGQDLTIVPLSPADDDSATNLWIASNGGSISIPNSDYAPGNVRTQTEDGPVDPAFLVTVFSGGVRAAEFSPADLVNRVPFGVGSVILESEYVGKTFRFINGDGSAHELALEGGAVFNGNGVANPGADNRLTFPTIEGAYVVVTVSSNVTVTVETIGGATTSTVVRRRRSVPDEPKVVERKAMGKKLARNAPPAFVHSTGKPPVAGKMTKQRMMYE